jgi:hypothetical protein
MKVMKYVVVLPVVLMLHLPSLGIHYVERCCDRTLCQNFRTIYGVLKEPSTNRVVVLARQAT